MHSSIVCHRGYHNPKDETDRPLENTVDAYKEAWTRGFTHAECDVAMTKVGIKIEFISFLRVVYVCVVCGFHPSLELLEHLIHYTPERWCYTFAHRVSILCVNIYTYKER